MSLNNKRGYIEYMKALRDEFGVINIPATNTTVDIYRHPDGSIGFYNCMKMYIDEYAEFKSEGPYSDYYDEEYFNRIGLTPDHVLFSSEYMGEVSCDLWAAQMIDYNHYMNDLGGNSVEEYNESGSRHVLKHPDGHGKVEVTVNSVMSNYDPHFNYGKKYFGKSVEMILPTVPLAVLRWS